MLHSGCIAPRIVARNRRLNRSVVKHNGKTDRSKCVNLYSKSGCSVHILFCIQKLSELSFFFIAISYTIPFASILNCLPTVVHVHMWLSLAYYHLSLSLFFAFSVFHALEIMVCRANRMWNQRACSILDPCADAFNCKAIAQFFLVTLQSCVCVLYIPAFATRSPHIPNIYTK